MIRIELVNINGQLFGKSFSDQWNLEQLGYISIPHDRSNSALKRVRRANPPYTGFTFSIVKGNIQPMTDAERALITPTTYQSDTIAA